MSYVIASGIFVDTAEIAAFSCTVEGYGYFLMVSHWNVRARFSGWLSVVKKYTSHTQRPLSRNGYQRYRHHLNVIGIYRFKI